MNPAALKVNVKNLKPNAIILIDTDSFQKSDLDKAQFTTDDPFRELGLGGVQVVAAPISTMVKDGLAEFGLDNKSALRCKNMFALGLVCWLFERPLDEAMHMLQNKFAKKPAIAQANIKALTDGYNYGHNIHASVSTYRIESKKAAPGFYTDVNGNKATSYGLIAAAEKAGCSSEATRSLRPPISCMSCQSIRSLVSSLFRRKMKLPVSVLPSEPALPVAWLRLPHPVPVWR